MGFDWGGLGAGISGGPLGYGIYKAATSGGSTDVSQIPLMDPAQAEARSGLLSFAKSGSYGGYTAGTPYTGSLGDFGVSALEQGGLNRIGANANAGPGENYTMGADVLKELLTTDKYNPLNNEGVYSGLSGTIDRATREASDALKRNAGYGGSLYSTSTIRNLGQVAARGAETKANTLANMYQQYVGQKLGGVNTALSYDQQQQASKQQQLQNEMTYGGLPRTLNTAKDQADYAEFQRQQQEKQGQVTALTNLAGSNVPFGVPNVSIPNANPWLDVMNLLAGFGGKVVGGYAGGYGAAAGAKAGAA
jgi:hypothetical protein